MNFIVTLSERLSTLVSTKGLYTAGNWTSSVLCVNLSAANREFDGTAIRKDMTCVRLFCCHTIVDA